MSNSSSPETEATQLRCVLQDFGETQFNGLTCRTLWPPIGRSLAFALTASGSWECVLQDSGLSKRPTLCTLLEALFWDHSAASFQSYSLLMLLALPLHAQNGEQLRAQCGHTSDNDIPLVPKSILLQQDLTIVAEISLAKQKLRLLLERSDSSTISRGLPCHLRCSASSGRKSEEKGGLERSIDVTASGWVENKKLTKLSGSRAKAPHCMPCCPFQNWQFFQLRLPAALLSLRLSSVLVKGHLSSGNLEKMSRLGMPKSNPSIGNTNVQTSAKHRAASMPLQSFTILYLYYTQEVCLVRRYVSFQAHSLWKITDPKILSPGLLRLVRSRIISMQLLGQILDAHWNLNGRTTGTVPEPEVGRG